MSKWSSVLHDSCGFGPTRRQVIFISQLCQDAAKHRSVEFHPPTLNVSYLGEFWKIEWEIKCNWKIQGDWIRWRLKRTGHQTPRHSNVNVKLWLCPRRQTEVAWTRIANFKKSISKKHFSKYSLFYHNLTIYKFITFQ